MARPAGRPRRPRSPRRADRRAAEVRRPRPPPPGGSTPPCPRASPRRFGPASSSRRPTARRGRCSRSTTRCLRTRADRRRLAVDERVDGALRERERADRLDERVVGVRAAVQPGHAQVARGLERDLVLRAADLEDDVDRHALRHPLQRDRDRLHDGLVADHEVPVGGGVGRVRAARAHELETVAGSAAEAHGPATPMSPWSTKSIVSRARAGSQWRTVNERVRGHCSRGRRALTSSASNGAEYGAPCGGIWSFT